MLTLIEQPHPRISEEEGVIVINLQTPGIPLEVCEVRPNAIVILQDKDLRATTIGCSISKHMTVGNGYTIESYITTIGPDIIPELSETTSNVPSEDSTSFDHDVALRFVNLAIDVAEKLLTGEPTNQTVDPET